MKKEEGESVNFSSRISSITLTNFEVETLLSKDVKKLKSVDFAYEFSVSFKLDDNRGCVKLDCTIKVYSDKTLKLYLGEMESLGIFELKEYAKVKDKFKGIPNQLIANFAAILLSTTRGFLILKSRETIIDGAILPIIDARTFFNPKESPKLSSKSSKIKA